LGLFRRGRGTQEQTVQPAPPAPVLGPGDLELGSRLLGSIEHALGVSDAEIRRAIADLSRTLGAVDPSSVRHWAPSCEEAELPWHWLGQCCRLAESMGNVEFAPRAFVFCRWWFGLEGQLTINDYREMRIGPAPSYARAVTAACAITALSRVHGSTILVSTKHQTVMASPVRLDAIEELQRLARAHVDLPPAALGYLDVARSPVDQALLVRLARHGRGGYADFDPEIDPAPEVENEVALRFAHFGSDFVQEIVRDAAREGGWSAVGCERALFSATTVKESDPGLQRLLEVAVRHLRARVVPPMTVTGFEWAHWAQSGDGAWAVLGTPPARGSCVLTEPGPGEARHVATLTWHPFSNKFLVAQMQDEFVWIVDAPQSHDDPSRAWREAARNTDLWALYEEIAGTLQATPAWTAEDFAPFVLVPQMDLRP
jgi:hypothetical protein